MRLGAVGCCPRNSVSQTVLELARAAKPVKVSPLARTAPLQDVYDATFA